MYFECKGHCIFFKELVLIHVIWFSACYVCLLKTSFVITHCSGLDLWRWWKFRFGPLNPVLIKVFCAWNGFSCCCREQRAHAILNSRITLTPLSELIPRAVECLNLIGWRAFWDVWLFSGKCTASVVLSTALHDRITPPNYFCYFKDLTTKTHNDTGQRNKDSKQKDKIDRSSPCFCHKIMLYVRKAHGLMFLSLSRSLPHRHTYSLHTPYHKC